MGNRVKSFFINFIFIITLIIGLYTFCNGLFISNIIVTEGYSRIIHHIDIIAIIICILLVLGASKFHKLAKYCDILICISAFLVLFLNIKPSGDDASIILKYAKTIGDSILANQPLILNGYFLKAPWQIGLLILEVFLYIISFKHLEIALKLVNLLSVLVSLYYINRIYLLIDPKKSRLYYFNITKLTWIVPIFLINYFYGWTIGLSLSLLSIYYFLLSHYNKSNKYLFISLLSLLFATFFKANYLIIFIAYIIFFIIYNHRILNIILTSVVMIAAMQLPGFIVNGLDSNYKGGIPKVAYLTMGMQEGAYGCGWYNGYVDGLYNTYNGNTNIIANQAKTDLIDQVKYFANNPRYTFNFYHDKVNSILLTKDFQIHAYYEASEEIINTSIFRDITYHISSVFFFLIWFGVIVSLINILKNKSNNEAFFLLSLCFLGGFGYHILFEAKAIYLMPWVTLLIPICSIDNINYKVNKRHILVLLVTLIVSSIYNFRYIIYRDKANYTYENNLISMDKGNYLKQPLTFKDNFIITGIELKTNAIVPDDGNIIIELYTKDNQLVKQYIYDTNVLSDYDFSYFNFEDIQLDKNDYYLYIYTNFESSNFSLISGSKNDDTRVEGYLVNDYDTKQYLNFSIYGKKRGIENIDYIYTGECKE